LSKEKVKLEGLKRANAKERKAQQHAQTSEAIRSIESGMVVSALLISLIKWIEFSQ